MSNNHNKEISLQLKDPLFKERLLVLVAHLLHGIRLLEAAAVVVLKEVQQQVCQQRRPNDLEEQPEDLVQEDLEVQDYHINLKAFLSE